MIDHKELMRQGQELIAANLAECCREELEWQNTALLCNGKMREAGAIYAQVDASHALSIVQSEVARQAMQVIAAASQVVAYERATDWKDRLYAALEVEFALHASSERDADGQRMGLRFDDTQIGAEFAMRWFEQNASIQSAAPVQATEAQKQDGIEAAELQTLLITEFECYRPTHPAGLMAWAKIALLDCSPHRAAPVQAVAVAVPDGDDAEAIRNMGAKLASMTARDVELFRRMLAVTPASQATEIGSALKTLCDFAAPAPLARVIDLSDSQIVEALHSVGIDTHPSKHGFNVEQIEGMSITTLRQAIAAISAKAAS